MQKYGSLKVLPIPSFRNPEEVDLWMPDHGYAASGMTIIGILGILEKTKSQ
jgi:hypothetical protein